jgi:hypothetical protein
MKLGGKTRFNSSMGDRRRSYLGGENLISILI